MSPKEISKHIVRTSLTVQWLELDTFTARRWVQSLVRKIRPQKVPDMVKKKNRKKKKNIVDNKTSVKQSTLI